MANPKLTFTLWDVGHGVSIWINTPNGSNHWIDLGRTPEFSPSEHVGRTYRVADIDYLVISHPDEDHLEDLPQFKATFGDPRALDRNKSLPAADMFGQRAFQYQEDYADLHNRFTGAVPREGSPTNPDLQRRRPIRRSFARPRHPREQRHAPGKRRYPGQQHVPRRHAAV